jgi:putative phosphoesterase
LKLLVVSDNHGDVESLQQLIDLYHEKVDAMIHCGDSELNADDIVMQSFLSVRGNCDYEMRYPIDLVEEIKNEKVFITHGHEYGIKMSLDRLRYKSEEYQADFVFFGHSHLLGATIEEGRLYLNPGSIMLPRGRNEKTYAIVEKRKNRITVQFFDEKHHELIDLKSTFEIKNR